MNADRQLTTFVGRAEDLDQLTAAWEKAISGDRQVVSMKTVEFYLGNVFAKLGLANRRQLRDFVQQESMVG